MVVKASPKFLGALTVGALVCLAIMSEPAKTDSFVMPSDGYLYLQQMGGEAAGITTFGVGTSPSEFVPSTPACRITQVLRVWCLSDSFLPVRQSDDQRATN